MMEGLKDRWIVRQGAVDSSLFYECDQNEINSNNFNPFEPIVAFHVETCRLVSKPNQMTGFYVKCNTRLK